jgi:hypothetical protein
LKKLSFLSLVFLVLFPIVSAHEADPPCSCADRLPTEAQVKAALSTAYKIPPRYAWYIVRSGEELNSILRSYEFDLSDLLSPQIFDFLHKDILVFEKHGLIKMDSKGLSLIKDVETLYLDAEDAEAIKAATERIQEFIALGDKAWNPFETIQLTEKGRTLYGPKGFPMAESLLVNDVEFSVPAVMQAGRCVTFVYATAQFELYPWAEEIGEGWNTEASPVKATLFQTNRGWRVLEGTLEVTNWKEQINR